MSVRGSQCGPAPGWPRGRPGGRWPGRHWLGRHWLVADLLLAAGFALLDTLVTLGGGSWWPAHPGALAWTMLGLQAAADLALIARRRAPFAVIAVLGGFTLALSLPISPAGALTPASTGTVWAPYGTVLAAYGPFFYCRRPGDRRIAFAAVAVLTLIVAHIWAPSWEMAAVAALRTALGPLLALYVSARRSALMALTERAERAEREQHLLAEQARTDERARLAGEMHDVVIHRVSLMVLQAGALSVTAADEATRRAAEELRAAGCQALDELRDLVGILRAGPGTDSADGGRPDGSPRAASGLAELAAESTAVGTPAELVISGDPALASPVVARTVYRVVREALTNVRKHAPGARVLVQVSYEDAQVRLTVTNARPARPAVAAGSELAGTGSGLGLAGLRQRVELIRGILRAGPAPDGGFRLEATLPAYVATAEPAEPAGLLGPAA